MDVHESAVFMVARIGFGCVRIYIYTHVGEILMYVAVRDRECVYVYVSRGASMLFITNTID